MQAIKSKLDNFPRKWCSKKLVSVNHPILTQLITAPQRISSFRKTANIKEIISKSHKERELWCFRDAVLEYRKVDNLLNAGFEKERFIVFESDTNGLLSTIATQISKLCSTKKDCGKILESK